MADAAVYVARLGAKDETQAAFNSVQRNMNNTRKASKALNQQFRFMRGGMGQVGHQVQDIAVQLSMGTNAMIVFGQQGSQIASLFGPQGAMLGAVLAVGAAIGVSFTRDVKKGENALKDLEQSIIDAAAKTGQLRDEYRTTLIDIYTTQVELLNEKIKEQKEIQEDARDSQTEYNKLNARATEGEQTRANILGKMNDKSRAAILAQTDFAQTINTATTEITLANTEIDTLNKRIEKLGKGEVPDNVSEGMNKTKNSAESFIESLDRATISTESGAVAAKAYELSLLNLKGAELDSALAALGRYEQSLLNAEADKEAAKAVKDRTAAERAAFEVALNANVAADQQRDREQKAERKRRQASIDRLRTFEELKNEMGDTFLQMKKLEDGLVDVTENAMANFTDSFYDAISGAKNFKDAFKDMARSIVEDLSKLLIQYYITQQIFGAITSMFPGGGTTTSSGGGGGGTGNFAGTFEGGGFTGYGARSGGIDGKGGFPAILHPNETVLDHTKGQGQGVTIVQNINVTTGVQQTVRAEIANLLPQISNAAKAAVADSRMRGGGFSKAMVGS